MLTECFGKLDCGTELCPPIGILPLEGRLREVPDVLTRGEHGRRVGLDEDVDEDRKEVVCPRGVSTLGVLEEADEDTQALDDTVELTVGGLWEGRERREEEW